MHHQCSHPAQQKDNLLAVGLEVHFRQKPKSPSRPARTPPCRRARARAEPQHRKGRWCPWVAGERPTKATVNGFRGATRCKPYIIYIYTYTYTYTYVYIYTYCIHIYIYKEL